VAEATPSVFRTNPFLQELYVLRLQSFRTLHHIELNRLAFLEAAESIRLNGREMHEYVSATLTGNKPVALGVVKPLYCSLFQFLFLIFDFLLRRVLLLVEGGVAGSRDQLRNGGKSNLADTHSMTLTAWGFGFFRTF